MALQEREIALRKFEAGVRPGYFAPDFSFVSSKSSLNKNSPKTVHQKFSTHMRALSSLSQSSSFKDTSSLPPLQLRPRKTRSSSWEVSKREFDTVQDIQKSHSASPKNSAKYGFLEETGTSTAPYFLDKQ